MSRRDASLAFERHATSKLQSDAQLGTIRTMGFRGEALPSIAAVSNVRLRTVARDEPVGTQLWLAAGTVTRVEDTARNSRRRSRCRTCSSIRRPVGNFSNPRRRVFSHISHVVQQAGLAWPQVHLRLVHNGYEVFVLPAASSAGSGAPKCIAQRSGDRALAVDVKRDGNCLCVALSSILCELAPQNAARVIVNRRPIKNSTVQHAVIDGYSSFLAKGHAPLFVLFLDVEPQRVDVNITSYQARSPVCGHGTGSPIGTVRGSHEHWEGLRCRCRWRSRPCSTE